MVKPPPEAHWYLPTNVSVLFDNQWISGREFCAKHKVRIHVITAWNPGDERPGPEINESQNEKLRSDITKLGFDSMHALGSDPNSDHAEKSWAVIGLSSQQAIRLARKYGQVAVFLITESQQSVLGCFSDWEVSHKF